MLAGPYGSYQLALLGADVIKVESREGDDMRFGSRANDWEKRGLAAPWVAAVLGEELLGAFLAVRRSDAAAADGRDPDEVLAGLRWRY